MTAAPSEPVPSPAIIAEAARRSGVAWITVPAHRQPHPVWYVWRSSEAPGAGGAAYVVTGPGEQPAPGLATSRRVGVIVRSSQTGGRLLTWAADVGRVEPGSPEWRAVIGQLLTGRLNPTTAAGEASPAERWARTGAVYRLTPSSAG